MKFARHRSEQPRVLWIASSTLLENHTATCFHCFNHQIINHVGQFQRGVNRWKMEKQIKTFKCSTWKNISSVYINIYYIYICPNTHKYIHNYTRIYLMLIYIYYNIIYVCMYILWYSMHVTVEPPAKKGTTSHLHVLPGSRMLEQRMCPPFVDMCHGENEGNMFLILPYF